MSRRSGPEEPPESAGPLFDRPAYGADLPKARSTDPWTSHAAGRRVSEFASRQQAMILDVLRKHPNGLIVDDIALLLGELDRVQVGRRMCELRAGGKVRESGRTGTAPSGRQALVWEAV